MALFRCGSFVCGSVFEVVVQLCSGVVQLCVAWFRCGSVVASHWFSCGSVVCDMVHMWLSYGSA